jgi:hypothetical protein
MCERTWRLIASLADTSYCNAGDVFLAKKLDCSTRSVRRYVKKLRDSGRLTRTTVSYMIPHGWRKKRLMKTRFESSEFGLTRGEVLNWKRPAPVQPAKAVPMATPKKATNPYFEVVERNTIEGFGDPYHEDMPNVANPRPCDAQIIPKTLMDEVRARVAAIKSEALPRNEEYIKLSCRYIGVSIARARKGQK